MKRQVVNQFLFDKGQDAYKYGIDSSVNLLVDTHVDLAGYNAKNVRKSIRSMPSLRSVGVPLPSDILYLFQRDGTLFGVTVGTSDPATVDIVRWDDTLGYEVVCNIPVDTRTGIEKDKTTSCQCGKYEVILFPDAGGSRIYAFDTQYGTATEVFAPAETKKVAYATSICYWAGHLFLNDLNNSYMWYSSIVLTASDISQVFTADNSYRSMGYKDGTCLWVGILDNALWSISTSYIQKWTVSDSTLVPVYADTANMLDIRTSSVYPYKDSIALAARDSRDRKHLYTFDGKETKATETEEVLSMLTLADPVHMASFTEKEHVVLVFQWTSFGTYALDELTGLWCKPLDWDTATQVLGKYGLDSTDSTRLYMLQDTSYDWTRTGAIWVEDNKPFYCDRIGLRLYVPVESTVEVSYRMRQENEQLDDYCVETFTLGRSRVKPDEPDTYDIQVPTVGYGTILELRVVATSTVELYDARAEITTGGRW